MTDRERGVLLLCYGNPGRLDDGLGAAFAARMRDSVPNHTTVEEDYLLTVEHAASIAEHRVVIFVDAAINGPGPFSFKRVDPRPIQAFSTHIVEPGNLLQLAEELFSARTEGYCLGIRGYAFDDFGEDLSPGAEKNLTAALEFADGLLRSGDYRSATDRESYSGV